MWPFQQSMSKNTLKSSGFRNKFDTLFLSCKHDFSSDMDTFLSQEILNKQNMMLVKNLKLILSDMSNQV